MQEIVHEDDHEVVTLQSGEEPAKKTKTNEAHTLPNVVTTGKTMIQNATTDAPLHDERVIAVRDKFLDVSDDEVSGLPVPQHDDQNVQQDHGKSLQPTVILHARSTPEDQGFHQRSVPLTPETKDMCSCRCQRVPC